MALVLLNPWSRAGRGSAFATTLAATLRAEHPSAALHVSRGIDDTLGALRALPPASRVVLVGGDGSVHQALPALLERGHSLGLVALGSGDDGARAFGLRGLRWPDALAHALTAPATAVDVGWLQTEHERRPFLSSVNVGFDAAIAQRARALPGWLRGLPRYLLATLREVAGLHLFAVRLQADGHALHDGAVLFVSVLNTPTYGGGMPAVPGARIDDARLDLLLAGRFGRAGTLAMLPRLLLGRHLGHPRVLTRPFARLTLLAGQPLPLAADGEALRPARRIAIEIAPAALPVTRRN